MNAQLRPVYDAQVLSMELCGGRISNDGSAFMIEHVGIFTVELSLCYHDGRWRDNIYMLSVDLPPKFENDQPVALRVGEEEYPLAPMD